MSGLERFITAQERSYDTALKEIRQGRKVSHWMWYIFPQIKGLGRSGTTQFYGIEDLQEAQDYLAHPVLGRRLVEISEAMLMHEGLAPEAILGGIDALKLRSCATLFEVASGEEGPFGAILEAFYNGERCTRTRAILGL